MDLVYQIFKVVQQLHVHLIWAINVKTDSVYQTYNYVTKAMDVHMIKHSNVITDNVCLINLNVTQHQFVEIVLNYSHVQMDLVLLINLNVI
jgi:hypothetical protein